MAPGAALRVYQGHRYTIVRFINGTGKPPSAQAEPWWQRAADAPLAVEATRQIEADFHTWVDGRLGGEGSGE